jgi:hypothetical protein
LNLPEKQVNFLASFYGDRIQDISSADEVVKGIYSLIKSYPVDDAVFEDLIRK